MIDSGDGSGPTGVQPVLRQDRCLRDRPVRPGSRDLRTWRLLDHEIELALVIGSTIDGPDHRARRRPPHHVAAVTIGNDISARDVQLPEGQYLKGKSYAGSCPLGPVLAILDEGDHAHLDSLELRLSVNGSLRQSDSTANLVFRPAETLTELSTFCDLSPGTWSSPAHPGETAAASPPALVRRLANRTAARGRHVATVHPPQPRRPVPAARRHRGRPRSGPGRRPRPG